MLTRVNTIIIIIFIITGFYINCVLGTSKPINSLSSYKCIAERNVFRPLWKEVVVEKTDDKSRDKELEALKKAEEERKEAQKKAEEESALNNKKKDIEQNYILSGIVFDNGKKQAIIQDKKGTTYMLYENDTFEDMKVMSINNKKSEVIVDYKGKFTITFRME
jgi:type II secretory pathway component PulC